MTRALIVLSALGAFAGALALAAACDSSGTLLTASDGAAKGDTAALDSGTPGEDASTADAIEELRVADTCGEGPWINLGITVVALDLGNLDGSPLPGAQFTSPLCPGLVKYSDEGGHIEGQISKDTPFYARLQAMGYVSELAPEEVFDADTTGPRIEMLPTLVESFVGIDGGGQTIGVLVQKVVDDAGACSTLDGVSLAVVGHPEATVQYLSAASLPLPVPGATATTTRGLAVITGLDADAGAYVTLSGTKVFDGGSCHVVFQRGPLTGRVPLENGFVSLMPAYVTP